MDNIYLRSVELRGIHQRYDLDVEFNDTLTVLHGQNGTGKSTLIHILANIANCDFSRFAFLDFNRIKVTYSSGDHITLSQQGEGEKKIIKVESKSGAIFEFFKRSAIEDARAVSDDPRYRDYSPELVSNLEEFVNDNNLRNVDASYFPAFRTMLEAWSSQADSLYRTHPQRRKMAVNNATKFSRDLFGQFLPKINFPSPIDIEESLRDEIRTAQIRIARYESSIFSDSFVKVFSALLNRNESMFDTDELLSEISELTKNASSSKLGALEDNSDTYRELQKLVGNNATGPTLASSAAGALAVYRDALSERLNYQQTAFNEVDIYFNVVNTFLDKKELAYEISKDRRMPKVGLRFPDNTWSSIKVMSSGERQLLTMLYAVNKMSGNSSVLIDEPELSLHIDWQEDLLERMMEQLGDRQIIVCTHSPSIAADFDEYMKEIVPVFKETSSSDIDELEDYEELF